MWISSTILSIIHTSTPIVIFRIFKYSDKYWNCYDFVKEKPYSNKFYWTLNQTTKIQKILSKFQSARFNAQSSMKWFKKKKKWARFEISIFKTTVNQITLKKYFLTVWIFTIFKNKIVLTFPPGSENYLWKKQTWNFTFTNETKYNRLLYIIFSQIKL